MPASICCVPGKTSSNRGVPSGGSSRVGRGGGDFCSIAIVGPSKGQAIDCCGGSSTIAVSISPKSAGRDS